MLVAGAGWAAEWCDPKPAAAVASELTDPKAVARRAAELRAEVFAGIKDGDMTAVMQSMVRGAKQGDPRCARLLLDVLGIGPAVE